MHGIANTRHTTLPLLMTTAVELFWILRITMYVNAIVIEARNDRMIPMSWTSCDKWASCSFVAPNRKVGFDIRNTPDMVKTTVIVWKIPHASPRNMHANRDT